MRKRSKTNPLHYRSGAPDGVGVMFVPESALSGMHPILISLLSNGLVLGTLLAIAIDRIQLIKRKIRQSRVIGRRTLNFADVGL